MKLRQEELRDQASELRRASRSYWRKPLARVGLGGVGAALSLAAGQPIPAFFAALTALLEWEHAPNEAGPFSYLLEVQHSIGT